MQCESSFVGKHKSWRQFSHPLHVFCLCWVSTFIMRRSIYTFKYEPVNALINSIIYVCHFFCWEILCSLGIYSGCCRNMDKHLKVKRIPILQLASNPVDFIHNVLHIILARLWHRVEHHPGYIYVYIQSIHICWNIKG